MGQEIVYCYKCQRRIVGAEFADGKAFQVGNHVSCSGCAAELLHQLPPKDREQLLGKMFKATQGRPAAAAAAAPAKRQSTVRLQAAPDPPQPKAPPVALIGAGVGGALLLVVLLVVFGKSDPPPPPPPKKTPAPAVVEKKPATPSPAEAPAREAVQNARAFATKNPRDLEGQISAWRDACDAAAGTTLSAEARRELDAVLARRKDAIPKEWEELQQQARSHVDAAQYPAAIDVLQAARARYSVSEWTLPLDRRIGELHQAAARSAPPPAPPPPPPPPVAATGQVLYAEDFKNGRGKFSEGEIVDADPGVKAIAIPPKGFGFKLPFTIKPTTTVRFRLKPLVDLDWFECITWVQSKGGNAWWHVRDLKKGEWKTVEFKVGEMKLDYGGPPVGNELLDGITFYYLNRPESSRILLTDLELRE